MEDINPSCNGNHFPRDVVLEGKVVEDALDLVQTGGGCGELWVGGRDVGRHGLVAGEEIGMFT